MRQGTLRTFVVSLFLSMLVGCAAASPKETEYNLGVQAYRVKDYSSARQHWTRAVEEHEITAYNNLGFLLYYGLGGEPDATRAVSLWMTAAKSGETESQWHLGQAFEDGKGTGQSVTEAYAWYRCAAASLQATPAVDDIDAQIARDASQSLMRLLPMLTAAQFEASEKLAKLYIEKYSKRTEN
jgi:TPR repeat protein